MKQKATGEWFVIIPAFIRPRLLISNVHEKWLFFLLLDTKPRTQTGSWFSRRRVSRSSAECWRRPSFSSDLITSTNKKRRDAHDQSVTLALLKSTLRNLSTTPVTSARIQEAMLDDLASDGRKQMWQSDWFWLMMIFTLFFFAVAAFKEGVCLLWHRWNSTSCLLCCRGDGELTCSVDPVNIQATLRLLLLEEDLSWWTFLVAQTSVFHVQKKLEGWESNQPHGVSRRSRRPVWVYTSPVKRQLPKEEGRVNQECRCMRSWGGLDVSTAEVSLMLACPSRGRGVLTCPPVNLGQSNRRNHWGFDLWPSSACPSCLIRVAGFMSEMPINLSLALFCPSLSFGIKIVIGSLWHQTRLLSVLCENVRGLRKAAWTLQESGKSSWLFPLRRNSESRRSQKVKTYHIRQETTSFFQESPPFRSLRFSFFSANVLVDAWWHPQTPKYYIKQSCFK